ncbi:RNA 3'-terminal phosphate cyclase [Myxococcota bacterium]|nr:RNA 3'-terminal phosphate cyclase [Myxococcota bacterium]
MIEIDGSLGEGGGQIVRTSLGLATLTGQDLTLTKIRAGRQKSGLLRQHLTALEAAAAISAAEVDGASLRSDHVVFRPKGIFSGKYHFSVGTAGSAMLVLQTILPPLMAADGPSEVFLEGGTHNPAAPPFDFIERVFVPALIRMGGRVKVTLERHGFFPAGDGRLRVQVEPSQLKPIEIMTRGRLQRRRARALCAHLPEHVGQRELKRVAQRLHWPGESLELEMISDAFCPGNVLILEIESEGGVAGFTAFGRRGIPAERVADEAIDAARVYLSEDAPVDAHLADQLIIPMAMAGGGRFRAGPLTQHTLTQIETVRRFMRCPIKVERDGRCAEVVFG